MAPTEPARLLYSVETMPTVSKTQAQTDVHGLSLFSQSCKCTHMQTIHILYVICVCTVCNLAGDSFHPRMNRHGLSPAALYRMQPSPNIYFIV